jgi:hypothetical protein
MTGSIREGSSSIGSATSFLPSSHCSALSIEVLFDKIYRSFYDYILTIR